MFYSHEILTSHQYGIATIWLVATLGPKSNSRKITRRAILNVDVPKACHTIIEPPGAPLALRLQGNLLFGVSRVFAEQCQYTLSDAEKVQAHMRKLLRTLGSNDLNTNTAQAKRKSIVIEDDPEFDVNFNLPGLCLDDQGDYVLSVSQRSKKTSSQLSPLEMMSFSSGGPSSHGGLHIPRSSFPQRLDLASPFGGESMAQDLKSTGPLLPLVDDTDLIFEDLGLAIDAEGNIIENPHMPKITATHDEGGESEIAYPLKPAAPNEVSRQLPFTDKAGDITMTMGDDVLPDAEAFSILRHGGLARVQGLELSSGSEAPAPKRKKKAKAKASPDTETRINRDEFKSWTTDYLQRMAGSRKPPSTALAKARENATNFTFGQGIGGVGRIGHATAVPGFIHPLAEEFAGQALQIRLLGTIFHGDIIHGLQEGRRRSANEAFGKDDDEERRVKLRMEQDHGRGIIHEDNDVPMILDGDVEAGRNKGTALEDMSMPWNRPSSLVPGSSVKRSAKPLAQGRRHGVNASPLAGKGPGQFEVEKFGGKGPEFDSIGSQNLSSSNSFKGPGVIQPENTSQAMHDWLSQEEQNFLEYIQSIAVDRGDIGAADEDEDRRWVAFDDLLEARDRSKAVAAQAFYKVLSLATQGQIRVEQEGQNESLFGVIHLGVHVAEAPKPGQAPAPFADVN